MKTMRIVILTALAAILASSGLYAQDLSKYRTFSFGMTLTEVLKLTDRNLSEVKTKFDQPGLIQELNWWPPTVAARDYQADAVQQVLLSFYKGELYKITVTYDPSAVKGLTAEDMVQSISAHYGIATTTLKALGNRANEPYSQQAIAAWEDPQYSVKLVHSPFSGGYGLVMASKRANAEAETAGVEAAKLEAMERPQKEADRLKKEADILEIQRQKNKKVFQP
jgi:hypothetical protein